MHVPPPLRPGDRIRAIAPSGPVADPTLVWRGLGFLAQRYRVTFSRAAFERTGFLAGTDARRLDELNAALTDPDARAVIALRGGYGLTRITEEARWDALANAPKWLVGFSDITALHVEAARHGIASLHAHNVAGLGRGDHAGREQWILALETPLAERQLVGRDTYHEGRAAGPLFGGNLTVLMACAAAGRLRVPRGAILVLEDVSEAPYRVDRALTSLIRGGYLDEIRGLAFGEFTDCQAGSHRVPVEDVLRERAACLGVPAIAGLGVGHGPRNAPIPFGVRALLDAEAKTLTISPRESATTRV